MLVEPFYYLEATKICKIIGRIVFKLERVTSSSKLPEYYSIFISSSLDVERHWEILCKKLNLQIYNTPPQQDNLKEEFDLLSHRLYEFSGIKIK